MIGKINCFIDKNVQECYDLFLNVYKSTCEDYIPKKIERGINGEAAKWLTPDIKNAIRQKYRLWYFNNHSGWKNIEMVAKFKELRKQVKTMVKTAIKAYEFNLASKAKSNPKLVYSYINSKRTVRDNIRALTDKDGVTKEDGSDIVNILNDQFNSVFEKDNGRVPNFENKILNYQSDWIIDRDVTIKTICLKLV